jgi:hypothetical protein
MLVFHVPVTLIGLACGFAFASAAAAGGAGKTTAVAAIAAIAAKINGKNFSLFINLSLSFLFTSLKPLSFNLGKGYKAHLIKPITTPDIGLEEHDYVR